MPTPLHVDRIIARIAAGQHGLVTRAQLLSAGVQADTIRSRVRLQRLTPVQRGVYQVGPVTSTRAREMAAVLACGAGAVVSHRSAGMLWQISVGLSDAAPVVVTVTGGDRGHRPGIRVHRVRVIAAEDVATVDGVPVTSLARTVLDLAGETSSGELRQILARALREPWTSPASHRDPYSTDGASSKELRVALKNALVRFPNRRGVAVLRVLLEDPIGPALTRSEAEEQLLRLIRKAQLRLPEVNARMEDCEVDFLWRTQRLVVEVDGFAFHSSRSSFESDRRRDAKLAARGFRVMRITWRQVEAEPEAVLVRIANALAQAGTA